MTAIVNVAVSPASVTENGTTNLIYTFTRTGDPSLALAVNVDLSGTATTADFAASSSLTLAAKNTESWTRLLGSSGEDYAYALTTGLDGSIYVSGITKGSLDGQASSGNADSFLARYGADGVKAWTRVLASSSGSAANALTAGIDGSIYVSGVTNANGSMEGLSSTGGADAFLTKYSGDGVKVWTRLLGSSSNDVASGLTTGLDGSVYVSGWTGGSLDGQPYIGGSNDAFLTKYSADGVKAWTRLFGSSGDDRASALSTGLDGSIYVGGTTAGSSGGFLAKFGVDGTNAWTRLLGSSAVAPRALKTGLDGSIYISGSSQGSVDGQPFIGGSYDAFLTKYSADGVKAWTRLFGSSGDDVAWALNTGLDGSIYVSGGTNGLLPYTGSFDALLTKFSSDGAKAWSSLLGFSAESAANALTTGLDGSIYVGGFTFGSLGGQLNSGSSDAFITKFSVSPQITFAAGSSTATLVVDPTPDSLVEGAETVVVTVLAGTGYTLGTAAVATGLIVDAIQSPTYAISAGSTSVNEGSTATFMLTTTNVASGTAVPYTLSGVSAADITGGLLSGTATLNSSGTATISVPIAADLLTEGAETLSVTAGGASASTTVNDTSITSAPTYAMSASSTSANEGSIATFTLTTTNVASGTSVPYTLSGSVNAADITGAQLTGSVTISAAGTATISVTIFADSITEEAETLTATVQGQSASVTVNDMSKGAVTTNLAPTGGVTIGAYATPVGRFGDIAKSVAMQTDGKVLVGGYSFNGVDDDFALVRYNSDGSLDKSFSM
jgi:uncharacterized delta-60 repeat protein